MARRTTRSDFEHESDASPKALRSGKITIMPNDQFENTSSPRDTETELIAIWREVLGLGSFGSSDSFLELGGDSLAAMLCISRIRSTFDVEFELTDFFLDDATVSGFAANIERSLMNDKPNT